MTPEPADTATSRTGQDGSPALDVDLPADIFDVQVNIPLIHQVVVAQQAAARQGTHATLTRGEVRGGGRKPYKQKGTGRARQGSVRAPQFAGGGTVHGPRPRSHDQRTPKKMKAAALRGALSDRARAGRVHVVEALLSGDAPSTKAALAGLGAVTSARVLVVLERGDNLTWLSLRNVPTVHLLAVDQLNTYDVLLCDDVVFTKGAFDTLVRGARRAAPAENRAVTAPASDTASDTATDTATEAGALDEDGATDEVTEEATEGVVTEEATDDATEEAGAPEAAAESRAQTGADEGSAPSEEVEDR
jgi:large subunit ribosomal protein L4